MDFVYRSLDELRISIEERRSPNLMWTLSAVASPKLGISIEGTAKPAFAKTLLAQDLCFGEAKVEPEGIEPSSKRPQHGPSTCLATSLVFDLHLRKGTLMKA